MTPPFYSFEFPGEKGYIFATVVSLIRAAG
jgi:hypothetical protein